MPLMLRAQKAGPMSRRYEITEDGREVASFRRGVRTGRITADGVEFAMRFRNWGKTYTLATPDGRVVAEAHGVGSRNWSVLADGVEHRFERPSLLSRDIVLLSGDRQVGGISKLPGLPRGAEADLPGLSAVVRVFVVAAVLDVWDRKRAAAGAAASGASASG